MRIAAITAITALMLVGCGSDDAEVNNTTPDTGTMVTDTGTMTTDTGTMTTDTGTGDTPTPLPTGQIDRMGRPAINTALVSADLKDEYNKLSTYGGMPSMAIQKSFNDSLIFIDGLDGKTDWTLASGTHPRRDALPGY